MRPGSTQIIGCDEDKENESTGGVIRRFETKARARECRNRSTNLMVRIVDAKDVGPKKIVERTGRT